MGRAILGSLMIPLLCACIATVPAEPSGAPTVSATSASTATPTSAPSEAATDVASQPPDTASDEEAVYAVLFAENPGITLLRENTATDTSMRSPQETAEFIQSGLPAVSDETIQDYLENNEQASQLAADMDLGVAYQLLSAAEFAEISSQPNWGAILQEKYPGTDGYMFFSRAGFNDTHDQALIYVGRVYGPLAGEASYYLLEKNEGRWTIVEQINRVMS